MTYTYERILTERHAEYNNTRLHHYQQQQQQQQQLIKILLKSPTHCSLETFGEDWGK